MNKSTTKREHIDYAMRKIIQRYWNKNLDGGKHESIKHIADVLGIPYTTLRDELKRCCEGGVCCFYLREKNKYQYFAYSADRAEQDACEKGSHKGPRIKITNTFLEAFTPT